MAPLLDSLRRLFGRAKPAPLVLEEDAEDPPPLRRSATMRRVRRLPSEASLMKRGGFETGALAAGTERPFWTLTRPAKRQPAKDAQSNSTAEVVEQKGGGQWSGVVLGAKGTTRQGHFPATAVKLTSQGRSTMQRSGQRQAKKVALPSVPVAPPATPSLVRATDTCPNVPAAAPSPQPPLACSSENPDVLSCLAEAKAVSSGHASMLSAVRSPRHRTSTGSNYSAATSSSSGFESLKSSTGAGRSSLSSASLAKSSAGQAAARGASPVHSVSRHSLHSGSSSSGAESLGSGVSTSMERLDESGYASQANIVELLQSGASAEEIMAAWLHDVRMDEYLPLFLEAGYDLPSLARSTPEDLTAVGVSKPPHRKRLTHEIQRLNVGDPWPSAEPPGGLTAWLSGLNLPTDYAAIFQREGFHSVAQVKKLTWEDFADFGIAKLGHLKRLELGIKKLRTGVLPPVGVARLHSASETIRPYAHLNVNQPPYQAPMVPGSPQIGLRAPSPSTFQGQTRPFSPQLPQRNPSGGAYDTFPRRGYPQGSEQLVTQAVVHEEARPTASVRPQPSPLLNGRRSSLEVVDELNGQSHYANFAHLPTSPRIRLNLTSPSRKLSDGCLKTKPPPPPPPKRSPHPEDPSSAPPPLFPSSVPPPLNLSAESCVSTATSAFDCAPPPSLRTDESMRNLREMLEKRTAPDASIPFANDNCGTIKSRHSPDARASVPQAWTDGQTANCPVVGHNGEVLNDIGDMLQNLTDELDALLVPVPI